MRRYSGEAATAGRITDIDVVEAVDYHTMPRGQKPGSPNKLKVVPTQAVAKLEAFYGADL